jgi:hypothetical protein
MGLEQFRDVGIRSGHGSIVPLKTPTGAGGLVENGFSGGI